jgi:predicted transcriptional regulator
MRELIDRWFGGSATELVMTLIEDRQVSEEKLTELRNRVNRAEANADGKN